MRKEGGRSTADAAKGKRVIERFSTKGREGERAGQVKGRMESETQTCKREKNEGGLRGGGGVLV